jgi:phosphatidylglycerol---prolipoprotein diacylglyceryl transferase
MAALAVLTVTVWIVWQARKDGTIPADTVLTASLIGIPSGVIFSKVLHVVDMWSYYWQNPSRIFSGEGLTIWGGVLGAAIGIWIYSKVSRGFRFSHFGDLIAPGIILAMAIGRVGCTLNGCCYGLESDAFCAIVYTSPTSYGPVGIPVLPTQVFEILYDLAVFGILISLKGKLKPEGSLFAVYFALYGAWRFGIEFIRQGTPFVFGMHQAQFIGLVVMLITVPFIVLKTRWVKKEP